MLSVTNETSYDPNMALLSAITQHLTDRDVELFFTDDSTISSINQAHRQINHATDVLSFPLEPIPHAPLGEIVLNIDAAQRGAKYHGHTTDDEIALLFIHGLLHLLGYDHERDEGQMRQKEEEIIMLFHLPKSLIVRTEESQ